jgi:hypothetical protein
MKEEKGRDIIIERKRQREREREKERATLIDRLINRETDRE